MLFNQVLSKQQKVMRIFVGDLLVAAVLLISPGAYAESKTLPVEILFDRPASDWESESLPIGNGALGANVMGGINLDELQFAEKTLWTGGPHSQQGYDFGLPPKGSDYVQKLASIQAQLKNQQQLAAQDVAKVLGRETSGYGSYQNFASAKLRFFHNENDIIDYRRSLDLTRAVATVSYEEKGINYKREYFVSYPDQVIVTRLSADQSAKINVELSLVTEANRSAKLSVKANQLSLSGQLQDNALQYATTMQIHHTNGEQILHEQSIEIKHADEVWFALAANTNYRQHYPDYRGEDALPKVANTLAKLVSSSYQQVLHKHLTDYRYLFSRVTFNLQGQTKQFTTPELLAGYRGKNSPAQDRALEELYFQYGRYLLISSSRDGSLPANLQGVWNKYEHAPWSADYHVNINLQMNYWLADLTNLSETLPPLFDFVDSLVEPGERTAQRLFDAEGWTLLLNTNIWGFTGLIAWPTAFWQPEGAAWMARHYFEHYLFTQDKSFLRQRAYPVMLGATDFWLDSLQTDEQQKMLVSPSYSPEHGDFSAGAAMSQQIVFDLLDNTLAAARVLGDRDSQARIEPVLAKLDRGIRIGSWGQLQEWSQDLDDKASKHRHVSHLYALYPGTQISPLTTPEFAAAARTSLEARGDEGTGWSKAWKINFWARLLDGNRAHKLLAEQLLHSTLSNLWDNHPPFQIDGNFGATAGIAEMLLQSHKDEIHLLPALPDAWSQGSISGLKARGNVGVELSWENRQLRQAYLTSEQDQQLNIRCANCSTHINLTDALNNRVEVRQYQGGFSFRAKGGETYRLLPHNKLIQEHTLSLLKNDKNHINT